MEMINADYDVTKIDKNKKVFSNEGECIYRGFIKRLKPKIRTYDKFITESTERLQTLCSTDQNHLM